MLWRFTRDGGFGSTGCAKLVKATFDINTAFCGIKPAQASWQSIIINNRPPELTGGTIVFTNSLGNQVGATINVGTLSTYPVSIPATPANNPLTVTFTPIYSAAPTTGYTLSLTYNSMTNPQICYKAVVNQCGAVTNQATMSGDPGGPVVGMSTANASVNLGNAIGPACTPGLLKICKVAGPGISIGQPFTFTAGGTSVTVPAGPAPGGSCAIGPSLPVGTPVTVTEVVPAGIQVSNIAVMPAAQQTVAPNLAAGTVGLTLGNGVTEVTYTDKRTGWLEICKAGAVRGNFSFTVNPGNMGPVVVPAGACSPAFEVGVGTAVIQEAASPGGSMTSCSTFPAGQQGACNIANQTSTVTVVPGDISTMTVAVITNQPGPACVPGPGHLCPNPN